MRLELQQELFRRYPKFFRKPGKRELFRCISPCHDAHNWDSLDQFSDGDLPLEYCSALPLQEMEAFEALFSDDTTTFDEWGVECGDGWFDLVESLAKAFQEEIGRMISLGIENGYWPRVAQIKQKFGSLRFRVRPPFSAALRAQIRTIEEESYLICGNCGGCRDIPADGYQDADCERCEAQHALSKTKVRSFSPADREQFLRALRQVLDSRSDWAAVKGDSLISGTSQETPLK